MRTGSNLGDVFVTTVAVGSADIAATLAEKPAGWQD